jgi:hypothetical protein
MAWRFPRRSAVARTRLRRCRNTPETLGAQPRAAAGVHGLHARASHCRQGNARRRHQQESATWASTSNQPVFDLAPLWFCRAGSGASSTASSLKLILSHKRPGDVRLGNFADTLSNSIQLVAELNRRALPTICPVSPQKFNRCNVSLPAVKGPSAPHHRGPLTVDTSTVSSGCTASLPLALPAGATQDG